MNVRIGVPVIIASMLRSAVRAILGVALVFVVLFVSWFTFEFLTHLKGLLARTIFSMDW
jgi:hypothetical protein